MERIRGSRKGDAFRVDLQTRVKIMCALRAAGKMVQATSLALSATMMCA